eukprot:6175090-Pleurochrysis_carterae.AAC.1
MRGGRRCATRRLRLATWRRSSRKTTATGRAASCSSGKTSGGRRRASSRRAPRWRRTRRPGGTRACSATVSAARSALPSQMTRARAITQRSGGASSTPAEITPVSRSAAQRQAARFAPRFSSTRPAASPRASATRPTVPRGGEQARRGEAN